MCQPILGLYTAEIIILLVINSVEKIILGLEMFYDVLTSVEKIGEVTDMAIEDDRAHDPESCYSNITLHAERLSFEFPGNSVSVLRDINLQVSQGEKIVLEGRNGAGKTTLMRIMSGLLTPTSGSFFINDDTYNLLDLRHYRSHIGVIINGETPFDGTIRENLTFNDGVVSSDDIRWALTAVKLDQYIKSLRDGLNTVISPEGKQMSTSNAKKILLARSIIHKPLVLFYEDPTDTMDDDSAREVIDFIMTQTRWTVIVTSKNPYWKTLATRVLKMDNGQIISDTKTHSHA